MPVITENTKTCANSNRWTQFKASTKRKSNTDPTKTTFFTLKNITILQKQTSKSHQTSKKKKLTNKTPNPGISANAHESQKQTQREHNSIRKNARKPPLDVWGVPYLGLMGRSKNMVWEGRIRSSEKMMFGGAGERSILFVLFFFNFPFIFILLMTWLALLFYYNYIYVYAGFFVC